MRSMKQTPNAPPPDPDFPEQAAQHLADNCNCNCQSNAVHVRENAHWPSCMVGKAQAYLGRKVKFCNPNKEEPDNGR